jgi:hypothetical protein
MKPALPILASLLLAAGAEQEQEPAPSTHWAYRPIARPELPHADPWARTPVDRFILATLRDRGLAPSPEADRRTLLRRVSFDLTGLPPTPEETDEFLADASPDAYERAVDRLLASPRHGERWARHWMDVAHFAETHGHDQDRPRENAWPYRDYLIRAFNEDKPYARFVEEQVAGDVLYPDDPAAIAATGFLAAGPWDESSLRDIRPDSIDRLVGQNLDRDDIVTTVMSTFTSTTVHCARCHDHKFDPVSQREYYALQAVFAGVDKANRPYDQDPKLAARRRELQERMKRMDEEKAPSAEVAAWENALKPAPPWRAPEILEIKSEHGSTLTRQPDGSILAAGTRPERDTYTLVMRTGRVTGLRVDVLTHESLPKKGPGRADNGNLHLSEFVVAAAGGPLPLAKPKADFDQAGWESPKAIDGDPTTAWGIHPKEGSPHRVIFPLKEPVEAGTLTVELKQLHGGSHLIGRFTVTVTDAPTPFGADELPAEIVRILTMPAGLRGERERDALARHVGRRNLEWLIESLPAQKLVYCGTPQFKPDGSFAPAGKPRPVHLLRRGDIHAAGPEVPPGALSCLRLPFALSNPADEGARREALARWLTDPRNALTWRSIVNRVWHYHFGRGLVETLSDFGRMGAPPSHPALLDWLASWLLENGGSLKRLHRLLVTSAVYRQSSAHEARHAAVDADNRFLWRMNRTRLDAESIRDAVLLISGKLDPSMGGPSVRQFNQKPGIHVTPEVDYVNFNPDDPANHRRSVYRFIFRTLPDPFMETLDCPDASLAAPRRESSVTALQALAMLNDKFMIRQSEHLAARLSGDPAAQVRGAYRAILGRAPSEKEAASVGAYAARHGLANACRFLFNTNEFMFVD